MPAFSKHDDDDDDDDDDGDADDDDYWYSNMKYEDIMMKTIIHAALLQF
jgi:hypothetical protein